MVAETMPEGARPVVQYIPSEQESDGIGLGEIFATLYRRRGILLSTVFGILLAGFLIIKLLTPSFTAQAVLVLATRHDPIVNLASSALQTPPLDPQTRSEADALQSRTLVDRVIDREDLMNDPEFNQYARAFEPNFLTKWGILNYLPNTLAKFIRSKPLDPDLLTPAQLRYNTATFVLKSLDVEPDPKTYTTKVNFSSIDAEKAARITNAFIDEYMDTQTDEQQAVSVRSAAWINARLAELAENARNASAAVAAFKEQHNILDLPSSQSASDTLTLQEVQSLTQQLADLRGKRADLEASVKELETLTNDPGAATTMPAITQLPLIEALRTQETTSAANLAQLSGTHGERHPAVIAATAELKQIREQLATNAARAVSEVQNQLHQSRGAEQELQGRIAELTKTRTGETKIVPELIGLEAAQKAAETTYDAFVQGYSRALIEDGVPAAKGQVVQYAEVLDWPTFPNLPILMAVIALAAVMIGVAVAYAMEASDTSYRSASALEAATSIPVFGMTLLARRSLLWRLFQREILPQFLRRRSGVRSSSLVAGTAEAEIIGLVRNAICTVRAGRSARVVMVTSALPGEGKSALALSLASSAVLTGNRALIIEGDMRKPGIAKAASIAPKRGLAEFLRGEASLDEVLIRHSSGVDILPVAVRTVDAVSLLRSYRMAELLTESQRHYDLIVLDTPPVMLVEDALQIDHAVVDAVVIAVKWGGSPRAIVDQAFRRVIASGLPLVGSVMTQVDRKRYSSYGNGRLPVDFAGRYYLVR